MHQNPLNIRAGDKGGGVGLFAKDDEWSSIFSRSSRRSENIVGSEGGGVGSSAKEEDKELGVGALDSIVVITRWKKEAEVWNKQWKGVYSVG